MKYQGQCRNCGLNYHSSNTDKVLAKEITLNCHCGTTTILRPPSGSVAPDGSRRSEAEVGPGGAEERSQQTGRVPATDGDELPLAEMMALGVDKDGRVEGYLVETYLHVIDSVHRNHGESFIRLVIDNGGVNAECRIPISKWVEIAEKLSLASRASDEGASGGGNAQGLPSAGGDRLKTEKGN